jgi:RIO kinase 1
MSKRKQFRELDEMEEQEILAEQDPVQEALEHFFTEGLITEVLHVVKSGKEATVYCCQAHPSIGVERCHLESCVTRERKQAGRDGRQRRPVHVI